MPSGTSLSLSNQFDWHDPTCPRVLFVEGTLRMHGERVSDQNILRYDSKYKNTIKCTENTLKHTLDYTGTVKFGQQVPAEKLKAALSTSSY